MFPVEPTIANQGPPITLIHLIPPHTSRNLSSSINETSLWNPVVIENGIIDVNAWGLLGYEPVVKGTLNLRINDRGVLCANSDLNLAEVSLKPWNVIAYPEVIYGIKPWTPELVHNMHESLKLPMKLSEIPHVYIVLDYAIINTTTGVNLAFDSWILRKNTPSKPGKGDIELMLWVYRGGPDRSPQPAGSFAKKIGLPIFVDGVMLKLEVEIWVQREIGDGWTYVAFVIKDPRARGELIFSYSSIVHELVDVLGIDLNDYYLYSIELGFEIFYAPVTRFNACIYKYQFVVSSETLHSYQLTEYTSRSYRVIAWITPWGYTLNLTKFKWNYTPGIVIPYDVDCGLCTSELLSWLNKSMEYLKSTITLGRVVFINLFAEKYYPSWRWRGELRSIVLNYEVLMKLREMLWDGELVYIGFSEMTACVNTRACLTELINAYHKLRKIFPAARLYYYGSSGDNVDGLYELYREADLDIVGIDIWSYKYVEGILKIAPEVESKISDLLNRVPHHRIIIGEIGLRLNDAEAYIEPWSKNVRKREEKAHITYYKHVFQHLREIGFEKGYIGIWAWNDDVFSIMIDSDLQELILNECVELGVLGFIYELEEETKDITYKPSDHSITVYLIPLIIVFTATLLIIYKRKSGKLI